MPFRHADNSFYALGVGATFPLVSYTGPPANHARRGLNGRSELRAGVWFQGNAALAAGQLEGGAQLETLGLRDTFYGAFGLRAGFGFGSQYSHEQPRNYFVASVTYGLRSAPYREDYFRGLARSLPRTGAAAVVRVVFSARHFYEQRAQPEQATAPSWSLHLGLELSPSYLWNLYLYPRERPWRCRAYVLFFC